MAKAEITEDERGNVAVAIEFGEQGREKMGKLTEGWIDKQLAILVDGKVIVAPTIKSKITNSALITEVTATDANRIVKSLGPG